LSLGTLSIARESLRDFRTSLPTREPLENSGFAAGIALRCGTGVALCGGHCVARRPARVEKFSLPVGRFAKESGLTSPVDSFRAGNRNRGSATSQHQCPKEAQQQALCPAYHYFHLRSLTCLHKVLPLASIPCWRASATVSSRVFCLGLVLLALRPTVSPECMLASSAGASFSATSSTLRLAEPVAGRSTRS